MSTTAVTAVRPFERKLVPVVGIGMAALTSAITGGILVAAQIGEEPELVLPSVLMGAAIVLETTAIVMLVTIRPFAWTRFAQVLRWALLAYVFQAGIIEWSFIKNDLPGRPLAVLTVGLVVFATAVPLMIAFTVARYQAVAD
ncbi:MAG: hypothetical protein M5T61_11950 [Acidimicrobiia bacterium]|nr:hypothetical protein [Acidimicrobiia bacterium]